MRASRAFGDKSRCTSGCCRAFDPVRCSPGAASCRREDFFGAPSRTLSISVEGVNGFPTSGPPVFTPVKPRINSTWHSRAARLRDRNAIEIRHDHIGERQFLPVPLDWCDSVASPCRCEHLVPRVQRAANRPSAEYLARMRGRALARFRRRRLVRAPRDRLSCRLEALQRVSARHASFGNARRVVSRRNLNAWASSRTDGRQATSGGAVARSVRTPNAVASAGRTFYAGGAFPFSHRVGDGRQRTPSRVHRRAEPTRRTANRPGRGRPSDAHCAFLRDTRTGSVKKPTPTPAIMECLVQLRARFPRRRCRVAGAVRGGYGCHGSLRRPLPARYAAD